MTISFVAAGAAVGGTSAAASIALAAPTCLAGDLLLSAVAIHDNAATITPPPGWSQVNTAAATSPNVVWFSRTAITADSGASFTFASTGTPRLAGVILAYRGANGVDAKATSSAAVTSSPVTAPSVTTTSANEVALEAFALTNGVGSGTITPPATSRANTGSNTSPSGVVLAVSEQSQATAGATTAQAATTGGPGTAAAATTISLVGNRAPNAPAVNVASTIDSGASNVIAAPFSDPDPGDSCSQTDFQWWDLDSTGARVGGPYTQTVTGAQPSQWTAPGGTFTNGKKEIQAKSYDALGVASPWGPSAFFTAATPTGLPTIDDPLNGGTIDTSTYPVKWHTAGGQVAYRVRRVADNAGAADATTVYWDSGQVTDANARSLSVPFETNNRYEHVQVSVTADGTLWSSWADVRVNVSYTAPAPATGSLSFDQASGSLLVTIANGTPTGSQPQNSYNDVLIDDGDGLETKHGSTLLPLNQPYRYYLPVSGRDYSGNVVVRVVGTNGVSTDITIN